MSYTMEGLWGQMGVRGSSLRALGVTVTFTERWLGVAGPPGLLLRSRANRKGFHPAEDGQCRGAEDEMVAQCFG